MPIEPAPFQAGFALAATFGSGIRRSWVPSMGRGLTEARAAVLPVEVGPGKGGTEVEASAELKPGCGLTLPKSGSPCGLRGELLQPLVIRANVMNAKAIEAAVGKRGVGMRETEKRSIEGFLLLASPLTSLEDSLRARLFVVSRLRVAASPRRFFSLPLPILTCFRNQLD